jgi:hypothetical protein
MARQIAPMSKNRILALVLCLASSPLAAHASWLRCIASGRDSANEFAIDTAVVNVGDLPAGRMETLKQKLLTYVRQGNPDATGLQANCFAGDDQVSANAHFSRSWMAMVRRLGWQNVLIITPDMWLADADYLDGPATGGK